MKSPMREQSFLPSIDNSYRANGNSLPPEVKIPQLYPGTPGKTIVKQGFNIKIGDSKASVNITINNIAAATPKPQKTGSEKQKKSKKESSSQNNRPKQNLIAAVQ